MEFSENNSLAYLETSAKNADNIEKAFEILIECLFVFEIIMFIVFKKFILSKKLLMMNLLLLVLN